MDKEQVNIPDELKQFLDDIVARKVSQLTKPKDREKKSPKELGIWDASLERFEHEPYVAAIDVLLGWLPSLNTWSIPNVYPGTHIGKFSSADSTLILTGAPVENTNDGYVKLGDPEKDMDVYVSAAFLSTGSFMLLEVDGEPMYNHIKYGDEIAKDFCALHTSPESTLSRFQEMFHTAEINLKKLSQVYFPVGDDYVLVTPLNPSGMFRLTDVLEKVGAISMRGESNANLKKRRGNSYVLMRGMWMFHFGSTKPQNISVLNQKYNGDVLLLPSFPPEIKQRDIKLPKTDFMKDCLYPGMFKELFESLNKAILIKHNNKNTRQRPLDIVKAIALEVSVRIELVRNALGDLDYDAKMFLPKWQNDMLADEGEWFDEFARSLAVWIRNGYSKFFDVELDDDAIDAFTDAIAELKEEF